MSVPDLRPQLARAQEWVATLIEGVAPGQLDSPTPDSQFNVQQLMEHIFAVSARLESLGSNGTVGDVPDALPLPDDPAVQFRSSSAAALAAWPDAKLDEVVTAPWGTMPGGMILAGMIAEHVTHGWDLAVATGQPSEADADLAELSLQTMQRALPAEASERANLPFGPAVEPAENAGPTERLANWTGRATP